MIYICQGCLEEYEAEHNICIYCGDYVFSEDEFEVRVNEEQHKLFLKLVNILLKENIIK